MWADDEVDDEKLDDEIKLLLENQNKRLADKVGAGTDLASQLNFTQQQYCLKQLFNSFHLPYTPATLETFLRSFANLSHGHEHGLTFKGIIDKQELSVVTIITSKCRYRLRRNLREDVVSKLLK